MEFNRPENISALLSFYEELKRNYLGQAILFSLDDFDQASYTSLHATITHDEFVFEDTDHENFEFLQANKIKKALNHADYPIDRLFNKLFYSTDDIQKLTEINDDPIQFLDHEINAMHFESFDEVDKMAFLPNGYFSCDLNIYENYLFIKKMNEYGWEFFGFGASLLGFIKRDTDIEVTYQLIQKVYNIVPSELLKNQILKQNYLILSYSETLADLDQL